MRALVATRNIALGPRDAAARCGLTLAQLSMLVTAGMMAVESTSNPLIKKVTTRKHAFMPAVLDGFIDSILSRCDERPRPDGGQVVSFQEAVHICYPRKVGFTAFLDAIREGLLPAFHDPGARNLSDLWLDRSVALAYRIPPAAPDSTPLYSTVETCRILHCDKQRLTRWRRDGVVRAYSEPIPHSVKLRWSYHSRDVDDLKRRYIVQDEAVALLGVRPLTFERLLLHGVIPIFAGVQGTRERHLFDRDELMAWRRARMTLEEAEALIGVARGTMRHWVTTAKLHPIPEMGNRHRWFWRTEIEAWAEDRISAQQVAALIGIDAGRVVRWANHGKLPAPEHQGQDQRMWFSRREILAWRQERMTTAEVGAFCGVHPLSVMRWEEIGKIRRISAVGDRPLWFDRVSVERWKAERDALALTNDRYRPRGAATETMSHPEP